MIAASIHWSVRNRCLVLLATLLITGLGLYSLSKTPVDALPDLSDVQVIIKTSFPGQAPQVVEDCWKATGKGPIGSMWLDIDKGDHACPD